jgi:hypothetical protein
LEDIGVDGTIILKWILRETGYKGVYRIHLAQNRVQWLVLIDMKMNLQVP